MVDIATNWAFSDWTWTETLFFFHCPIGGPFKVLSFDVVVELVSSSKLFVSELFRSIFVSSIDTIHQQENLSFKKRRNQYLKVTWTCLSQQTCGNNHTHLFWIYLGKDYQTFLHIPKPELFPLLFNTTKKGGILKPGPCTLNPYAPWDWIV